VDEPVTEGHGRGQTPDLAEMDLAGGKAKAIKGKVRTASRKGVRPRTGPDPTCSPTLAAWTR